MAAEKETFAPTVLYHGQTVAPPGWMWILGFALSGCEWAIKEVRTEEFKETVREWYRERARREAADDIARMEGRIAELKTRHGL